MIEEKIRKIVSLAELKYANVCHGDASTMYESEFTAPTDSAEPIRMSRRYLVASITKPIVAMAALKLAAAGEFSLSERIGRFLPTFVRAAYRRITVRHLLTHTSGFPDMLPENTLLRAKNASLNEFVEKASAVDLEFATATDCRYSSVGFLLLGAIIEKTTSVKLPQFLTTEFFQPLRMSETWLGLPDHEADDLMPTVLPSLLPAWQPDADEWGWNSRYWRTLGAPWGGLISTAADLGRYATMMLTDGANEAGRQVLPAAVVRAAMSDQLYQLAAESGFHGSQRSWGFGWRRQWAAHPASFGDFVSDETVGHWGATGTMMCIDPESRRFTVVLTTTPYEESQSAIQRVSNLVAAHES